MIISLLNGFVLSTFDKHSHIKDIRLTKPYATWLTPNLKLPMRERDLALQRFKCTRLAVDHDQYKELRNSTLSLAKR